MPGGFFGAVVVMCAEEVGCVAVVHVGAVAVVECEGVGGVFGDCVAPVG